MRTASLDERVALLLRGEHHSRKDLLDLAGDLLGAVEMHLTSAPAGGLEPSVSQSKRGTKAPSVVPNDCPCRCKSPAEHAANELHYSLGKDEAHVESWCIAAFYLLRPHPDRTSRRDELGLEFEKRVVSRYVYLAPELAAAAESAINPGTNAEQIRRVRQKHSRHRQTGARVPEQEHKPEEAIQLRADGHTVEQVAAALDCSTSSVEKWTRQARREPVLRMAA